eukprot:m.691229 g.691229  ORF g.691229 m.691229 type:complete len:578 (-) comp22853_c0_seq5:924-2657(-)
MIENLLFLVAALGLGLCDGAVPINTQTMKNFGHSIKNGHLIADTEINLFEHNCSTPPCTITQIHCPAAGPKWYDAIVKLYIDGEPPMQLTLLELANIGAPTELSPYGPPPPPPGPRTPPNYTEYFLGKEGATCTETCAAENLQCSPAVDTGYWLDKGVAMQKRLATMNASIAECTMDPTPWWAPDQPNYVCGNDPNKLTHDCVGWTGIPATVDCDGKYPESCRVCHCVQKSPRAVKDARSRSARRTAPGVPGTGDQGPWGTGLFGHTAANGAVYSTIRIPFGKSFRATLTSSASGTFWFIIRGVEDYPVVLGDLQLPPQARLKFHRFQNETKTLDIVTLADVPSGTAGVLVNVRFDAKSGNYHYLEACMRALIDGSTEPLFLSSGAEDYFLSAYYFDQGEFKTPNSGLTYYDNKGTLSAYKTHDRDPLMWSNGLKLVFRNMEDTTGCGDYLHCPNQYCKPSTAAKAYSAPAKATTKSSVVEYAQYKTLVWTYEWPQTAEKHMKPQTASVVDSIKFVAELGRAGLLGDEGVEANIIQQLTTANSTVTSVVSAYAADVQLIREDRAAMARAANVIMKFV